MPRKTTKKKQEGPSKQRSKDAVEGTPPDPPPPPPAALVKLLQKNKSVLKYFQALQENLDYDVKKWKLRARSYQAESQEWKAKAEELMKSERGSVSIEKDSNSSLKKRPADSSQQETDQPQKQRLRTESSEQSKSAKGRKPKETDEGSKTSSVESVTSKNHSSPSGSKLPRDETTKKSSKPSAAADEDWLDLASLSSSEQKADQKPAANPRVPAAAPPLNILAMSSEDSEDEENDHHQQQDAPPPNPTAGTPKRAPLNILALSSDDSGDDEDDDEYSTGWLESQFNENQQKEISPPNLEKDTNNQVLNSLNKANDLLLNLGIALIEETPVPQEDQKGGDEAKHLDSEAETGPPKVIAQRRADSCVLTDVLQTIKALVRIHVKEEGEESSESYYPFMTEGLIPCFMSTGATTEQSPPPHPAIIGMQSLSEAFNLMETYCPSLEEMDEHALEEQFQTLVLGMKERHTMVSDLLQSLEGEVCQLWPMQDRATRLMTTSLCYEPDDENQVTVQSMTKIAAPTKNLPRLAALVERCFLAQLVSRMHLARQDPRAIFQFFWRYLMATTPAIGMNSTPFKLPPIQSICVLESILCSGIGNMNDILASHWPDKTEWKWISQTICLLVKVTGTIQLARSKSEDDRIADTARVELAAMARLKANHPFWKASSESEATDCNDSMERISEELRTLAKDLMQKGEDTDLSPSLQSILLPALLVTLGNVKSVDNLFVNSTTTIDTKLACVKAKKCLEIRLLEQHRKVVQSPSTLVQGGMRLWDYSREIFKILERCDENEEFVKLLKFALSTCLELADGESAIKVLEKCLDNHQNDTGLRNLMETVGQAIVVRVINLERRPDRLASFLAQAAHCNLMVIRGVMDQEMHFGYALDGGNGRPAEIDTLLSKRLNCTLAELSTQLVLPRWRPNDLQVFDSEAPNSLDETRLSPSEKACALSHILSWKGVIQALEQGKDNPWRRQFQISGYARGAPLFPKNENMPPTPVCVILEDDAILVDRFQERLEAVLQELPRDFHWCSIGYSRPKTAPLIPYGQEISIPSCIWYLTGYIVSLEGCHFLEKELPVKGPVDSWIGLKMFGNWDNLYGHSMGVGTANKSTDGRQISKKDLRKLLKFRAYCATVPLCSQKVGIMGNAASNNNNSNSERNWRHRDTDIVYSGNSV